MKRHVLIGGKLRELELPEGGVVETQPGVYSVLIGERSYEVRLDTVNAEVNGRGFEMQIVDPREATAGAGAAELSGRREVKAPMPGKVVVVLVAEGDSVAPGQGLVVVEAMKMQNELKSPKTGMVVKISARVGATVAAGEVLITLE
jgi:biotin carboxyl carrier protein